MKKISIFLIVLLGLFAFASCDKNNDPGNHFSYAGKDYMIDSTVLIEWVLNSGLPNQHSIYQFGFVNIAGTDTTALLVAVYDTLSNTLGGNYPAVDELAVNNTTRAIFPFGFFFASGIGLASGLGYLTGDGGSIDISVSGNDYTINMNDISVGLYGDLLDEDSNGNAEYAEAGKINGFFKGPLIKYTQDLGTKKSTSTSPIVQKLLRTIKR